jgi:hypothetical protein
MNKHLIYFISACLAPSVCASANYPTSLVGVVGNNLAQTTSSTSFTVLPSRDMVTVDLPFLPSGSPTYMYRYKVTVIYNATLAKAGCQGTLFDALYKNNSGIAMTSSQKSLGLNWAGSTSLIYNGSSFDPGTYTFEVLHRTDTCSGTWSNRNITVFATPELELYIN